MDPSEKKKDGRQTRENGNEREKDRKIQGRMGRGGPETEEKREEERGRERKRERKRERERGRGRGRGRGRSRDEGRPLQRRAAQLQPSPSLARNSSTDPDSRDCGQRMASPGRLCRARIAKPTGPPCSVFLPGWLPRGHPGPDVTERPFYNLRGFFGDGRFRRVVTKLAPGAETLLLYCYSSGYRGSCSTGDRSHNTQTDITMQMINSAHPREQGHSLGFDTVMGMEHGSCMRKVDHVRGLVLWRVRIRARRGF